MFLEEPGFISEEQILFFFSCWNDLVSKLQNIPLVTEFTLKCF